MSEEQKDCIPCGDGRHEACMDWGGAMLGVVCPCKERGHSRKPPLGLRPRFIVAEHRVAEIDAAIQRYIEAEQAIPQPWTEEREELLTWLNRNTQHPLYPLERES